jgi:hypothetical protein
MANESMVSSFAATHLTTRHRKDLRALTNGKWGGIVSSCRLYLAQLGTEKV